MLQIPYPLIVRQWDAIYERGKRIVPTTALAAAGVFAYLAWQSSKSGGPNASKATKLYAVAAVTNASFVPWTLLFLLPTNSKLKAMLRETAGVSALKEISEAGVAKGLSSKELVHYWGTLNLQRAFLPMVGTLTGLWASWL